MNHESETKNNDNNDNALFPILNFTLDYCGQCQYENYKNEILNYFPTIRTYHFINQHFPDHFWYDIDDLDSPNTIPGIGTHSIPLLQKNLNCKNPKDLRELFRKTCCSCFFLALLLQSGIRENSAIMCVYALTHHLEAY